MTTSALATLTAQYTDSENEEENRDDDSVDSQASQVIIPKPKSPARKRSFEESTQEKKQKKRSRKVRRLVSYQDDTIISDEEEVGESESSDDSEESNENSNDEDDGNKRDGSDGVSFNNSEQTTKSSPMEDNDIGDVESGNTANSLHGTQSPSKSEKYAHYNFSLPPEPKGKPSTEVVEKIRQLYEKMQSNKMDMNAIIQRRKEFRNPSIYKKLIEFCDINEFGTNYPPEIYDPLRWGSESYYEELARVQKSEMAKRQKERKDTDKIEQATALARKVEEEAKKRKSKWDQPAKPILPPTLTTTVTGTKGTVISAFGSLPKKPAA